MLKSTVKLKAIAIAVAAIGFALWLYTGVRMLATVQGNYREWMLLAGAALAVGPFDAIKLNYLKMRFRLGDAFVIIIALLYGVPQATLTAALLGCIVAIRD